MNILSANLKHLYQRRGFWFLGFVSGAFAFGVMKVIIKAAAKYEQGYFFAPILWVFFMSVFIAASSIDVLSRPFSYCLPGHRSIPRKFLFFIGWVLSFLWSLGFLLYPDLTIVKTILACLSAFSIFTSFYWLGVWFVSRCRNWSVIFAVIPLIMLGNRLLNMSTIVVQIIVEAPLLVILSGGLVNFLAWRYWGRPNLARRYCGKFWMGAFDAWNKDKMSKYKLAGLAEKDKKKPASMRVSDGVEGFFVSRISGAETGSLRRYIWGGFYKTFGLMVSQQREDCLRLLMLMLPIVCFLCYIPGGGKNIIFFMPGIMVLQMSLWVHSGSLISGGRGQRFWSGLTLAATTGILVTVATVFLVVATHLLERVMPQLTVRGHEFVFNALNMKYCLVPFVMIPLTFTVGLIFYKKPMLAMIFVMVIFQILFGLSIVGELTIMNRRLQVSSVHLIIMLLCSWALFIGVLRYISMRCCLVSQSR